MIKREIRDSFTREFLLKRHLYLHKKLITTGMKNGLGDEETIKYSQLLDWFMNKYLSIKDPSKS